MHGFHGVEFRYVDCSEAYCLPGMPRPGKLGRTSSWESAPSWFLSSDLSEAAALVQLVGADFVVVIGVERARRWGPCHDRRDRRGLRVHLRRPPSAAFALAAASAGGRLLGLGARHGAQFVGGQDAVFIGIAALEDALHALGHFGFLELAVAVGIEGHQRLDRLLGGVGGALAGAFAAFAFRSASAAAFETAAAEGHQGAGFVQRQFAVLVLVQAPAGPPERWKSPRPRHGIVMVGVERGNRADSAGRSRGPRVPVPSSRTAAKIDSPTVFASECHGLWVLILVR